MTPETPDRYLHRLGFQTRLQQAALDVLDIVSDMARWERDVDRCSRMLSKPRAEKPPTIHGDASIQAPKRKRKQGRPRKHKIVTGNGTG